MKKLLFLLLAFMSTIAVNAEHVSRQQALQKAQLFMPGKQFGEARSFARTGSPVDKEPFYIFNAEGKNGFVIISGDDRTPSILGYAEQGSLEEDQMPDNMKWWLDNLARQIEALGTSLKPANVTSTRSGMTAIAPLIQTEWNQGAPYNYMCPDGDYRDKGDDGYDATNLCVTGCVATAMAQVLYYWKWPNQCAAIDSYGLGYYDENWNFVETNRVKGIPATTFKWNVMKTKYGYQETGEAADAVAELMRYCGQAVRMGYGVGASGANLSPSDLASVFNYSTNIRELDRDSYTTAQWEALVYGELSAEHPRPVLYSGRTSGNAGHQFIIDGYDGNGLFHMNWGWGYSGSYSVLSLADPNTEHGIGGSSNNGAFQYEQDALFGVKPAEVGEVMVPVLYGKLGDFLTKTYNRTGTDVDFTDVTLKATVGSRYVVTPETTLDVQVGWGLYQDDQFISCLASGTKTLPQRSSYSFTNEQTSSFGKNLAAGKYQLTQIYRFSDNEAWKRCENYGTNSLVAEISATSLTVRKPALDNVSFTVNSITTSEQPEVGSAMDIVVNVTNTGETSKIILNMWIQKSGAGSWTNIAQGDFNVDPGTSKDIQMGYTPTEAGTFTLKATDSSDPSDEALFTATVTIAATETVTIGEVAYLCTPLYKRATVVKNTDANKSVSSITIQQTVTASGVACQVKAIANEGLRNYWNISQLEIPEGIETVGKRAVSGLSNMAKLTLPSTLKSIDDYAFANNTSLESVVSHIANPCVVSDNVFKSESWNSQEQKNDVFLSPATLYIPINTMSKYVTAGWTAQFTKVEEGELMEGFDSVLKYSYSTGGTGATVVPDDSYKELTEVTIPATATLGGKTYQVKAVGNNAFMNCNKLTSLTLPEGLVSIGNYSFQSTKIKDIVFPATLKSIGDYAFMYCNLSTVSLPEGLESIGGRTFYYMSNLKKVVLPSSLTAIGDYAFYNNQNLSSVESHIAEPFDISEGVFATSSTWNSEKQAYDYAPSLAKLYVPIGSKSKYTAAKGWNMFATVEEGELKEGFDGALKYSYSTGSTEATVIQDDSYKELTEVTIPATATLGGKTYQVTTVGNDAFKSCNKLTSLTLPNGLVSIGKYSFYNIGVKEIVFPTTLKSIGDNAFTYCSQISVIVLPEGLESVGKSTFNYLSGLKKVILPSSILSIGENAFYNNQNLSSVESHITEPFDIPESAFAGSSTYDYENNVYDYSPSSATLYVPLNTKSKYVAAKGWNMFAAVEEGELKEGFDGVLKYSYSTGSTEATVIQDDSYQELTEVTIPATATLGGKTYQVTAVGNDAFKSCSKLSSVILPNGLVSIGKYSFYSIGVKEIVFPTTLKSVGDYAFMYCKMSAISLPDGLESVGSYAFYNMSSLQKVLLPSSVTSIGDYAFFYCQNLSSVESHIAEPFDISESVFASSSTWDNTSSAYIYSPSLAKLYVPIGSKSKYAAAKGWNMFTAVEEGEMKEGFDGALKYSYSTGSTEATVIQDDSYKELTEVIIPATATLGGKTYQVKAVGNDAFKSCNKLTSLTLPNGLVSIGNNAFQNTRMSSMTLPSSLKTIGNSAFEYCYNLVSVVIPEGVEKIGNRAFSNMSKLEKITLPSTLKEIGSRLLLYDSKLTTVVSNNPTPFAVDDATFIYKSQWNSETSQYDYTPSPATLYVPKGKVAVYQNTSGWNWFAAGIEEIKASGKGDANGDGFVDADDVKLIADYIMGKNPPGFNFNNANINGDSKVDAADLVLLVNMVKSLQSK